MKTCLSLLSGFVIFICHGDSKKQDYVHCINVSKAGRYPVYVGLWEHTELVHSIHVSSVVFFDRLMFSCGLIDCVLLAGSVRRL